MLLFLLMLLLLLLLSLPLLLLSLSSLLLLSSFVITVITSVVTLLLLHLLAIITAISPIVLSLIRFYLGLSFGGWLRGVRRLAWALKVFRGSGLPGLSVNILTWVACVASVGFCGVNKEP